MSLSAFIVKNKESILQAWENFARCVETPCRIDDVLVLRDHASLLLDTIVADLDSPQSEEERKSKSLGHAPLKSAKSYAGIHATQRLSLGYSIDQLVSEFRALRASVLRIWAASLEPTLPTDAEDIARFNEAIDQALSESVARFSEELVSFSAQKRDSEARFRTIANALPQMVWSTLPNGHHDYYNDQWYSFTGAALGSTDGDGWSEMFHPEDEPLAWAQWRKSLATGELYEIRYRLRHHSGQYRWVLGRALPVRDESGVITRWMGTCTDIHDQILGEDELKRAADRKDEFLAMLAHELRNPLAPISTAARILLFENVSSDRVRNASELISRQVKHMTGLVDDLLDVSRVTRGIVQLNIQRVNLATVGNNAIEQVRELIESRHHTLTVRSGVEPAYVQGDSNRLVQVVANLLNNAAKYTPQGGEIVLAVEVEGELVRLSVTDNGSGISADLLPHIFDLFTQGSRTPDRSQGGLGLGLALVKSIVELHGGSVQVVSKGAGFGSKFTVLLSLCAHSVIEANPLTQHDVAQGSTKSLRIMVVDDNKDAADTLAEILGFLGHQVVIKYDGKSALEYVSTLPPQVFILDIGLPDMDGYALARILRERRATHGSTFIAVTGYGQAQDRVLSESAGFAKHFVKPLDIKAFEAYLGSLEIDFEAVT